MTLSKRGVSLIRVAVYSYYGWESPLLVQRITGPFEWAKLELVKGFEEGRFLPERVSQADVVVIQRDFPRYTEAYEQVMKRARAETKPVILELDDFFLDIPSDHPDYPIHYYTPAAAPTFLACLEVDALTVASPRLWAYFKGFNSNTYLLPNYIDEHYWTLEPPRPIAKETPVCIGYLGTSSHQPEIDRLSTVFLELNERYHDFIQFKFCGVQVPVSLSGLPNSSAVELVPSDYATSVTRFTRQAIDIGIAPLEDNFFNRCKSSIKFLEYSAAGIPGVYSAVDPYTEIVVNGENGFLTTTSSEMKDRIVELIENPALRWEMGLKAQETVRRAWLLSQHAHEWHQVYLETLGRVSSIAQPSSPRDRLPYRASSLVQRWQKMADDVEKKQALEAIDLQLAGKDQELAALQTQLAEKGRAIGRLEAEIAEIKASRAWRAVQGIWRLRLPFVKR
jgi:glycosyltransferase involved in cell wall biosynthesis